MFADADSLDRLAGRIAEHADDLRARGGRLAAAAEATRWQSTAANKFRAEVQSLAGQYRRSAGGVDHAADALRRHASTVRFEQQLLADVEHAITGAVSAVGHFLGL
ncbi:MAG: hypothetical protein FWD74_06570 [Actinomycetia bacterium]|nr:hypothetical protein [Actinomycetes bacterium]